MVKVKKYVPGGDAKIIAQFANEHYGGFQCMFDAHGWMWAGQHAMSSSFTLVKERYGSIHKFEEYHKQKPTTDQRTAHDVLNASKGAWMKGFWGWSPETWGCVGYGSVKRRTTFFQNNLQTRLMFIYVTQSAKSEESTPNNWMNRIIGFYQLTEIEGHRNQFQEEFHHNNHPEKWQFSIKANRAFTIRNNPLPFTYDADPIFKKPGMGTRYGTNSDRLSDLAYEHLKACTFEEVPVYGSPVMGFAGLSFPKKSISKITSTRKQSKPVKGGRPNTSGYYVKPEIDSKKSLYILELCGDISAYLGEKCTDKKIVKVGLSYSPESRRDFFNRVIPDGKYYWKIIKSTLNDCEKLYSCYKVAETGEMEMKKFFHKNPNNHLSGEFYLAEHAEIEQAWKLGRKVALEREKEENG